MVSLTNCHALIIKNKGMSASVRSRISPSIIRNHEYKPTSRNSNIFPLMSPSPPLHYRGRYGRRDWPPCGLGPAPPPASCAAPPKNSQTSCPECPPLRRSRYWHDATDDNHPFPFLCQSLDSYQHAVTSVEVASGMKKFN